ncbi:hypothetical protein IQ250_00035 [Pseudanabaenaceae cyanobacterium LEGE 13415]|nr:hypothetical protein [Pseudanabaenaceae cyanobacterium LEGE 13415]
MLRFYKSRIPIITLSDSGSETDIFDSYALQGNSYVIKFSDHDRLRLIVQRIKAFWLEIVTLPIGRSSLF